MDDLEASIPGDHGVMMSQEKVTSLHKAPSAGILIESVTRSNIVQVVLVGSDRQHISPLVSEASVLER